MIPREAKTDICSPWTGENELVRANKLLNTLQVLLEASPNPDQYLIDICCVLITEGPQMQTDIAVSILKELGKYNYEYLLLIIFIILIYYRSVYTS